MPTWPATLPQYVEAGAQISSPANCHRSPTDGGIARQRRKYSVAARPVRAQILLTADQVAIFEAFYADELQEGTLPFSWVHPVTRETTTWRIVEGRAPMEATSGTTWMVTMDLEILP